MGGRITSERQRNRREWLVCTVFLLGLVFLGVNGGVATAYAVVLHLSLLLPVIAAGFLHLAIRGISFADLANNRAKNIAEEQR